MPKLTLNSAETYALRTALRDLKLLPAQAHLHAAATAAHARLPKPELVLSEVRSDADPTVFCEVEFTGAEAVAVLIGLQELSCAPEREYARLRALGGRLLTKLVPKRVLQEA